MAYLEGISWINFLKLTLIACAGIDDAEVWTRQFLMQRKIKFPVHFVYDFWKNMRKKNW